VKVAPAPRLTNGTRLVLAVLATGIVFAAYSNHFRNSFHFDDGTVIQNNAYLRSLRNIPLFFRDAGTFSSYPPNAAYRPLTSTSFALDYWWGGGIEPFSFHVTQWTLHLLLGVLIYLFLERILALSGLEAWSLPAALFGAVLFCVHRVNSETVNFLTLRSEILAALGVLGSFVCYQRAIRLRRSLVWLLPALAGAFAKPSAIIFAPLFLVYLWVFPSERAVTAKPGPTAGRRSWLWLALAPFAADGAFYLLQARLGGPRLVYGSIPVRLYLQTQIYAWLHYVRLFVLPLGLSADADWTPLPHWYDTRVVVGFLFAVAFVGGSALYARRREAGRAVFFGALWFYVALGPSSSLLPLSEMINEHRPYLPYVGLVLCLSAAGVDAVGSVRSPRTRRTLEAAAVLLLLVHAWGTFQRNRAWRDEESLWKSVTEASPANGRAWMNYGLNFMSRADYANARICFERAATLVPNYDILEINLGILDGATGRASDAERHFLRAIALNSATATAHFYYGRWLHENRRDHEAVGRLVAAIAASPADLEARHLLIRVYQSLSENDSACSLARETLRIAPADPESAAAASRSCPSR
jgi:Tfp pilus assembly protein PilF